MYYSYYVSQALWKALRAIAATKDLPFANLDHLSASSDSAQHMTLDDCMGNLTAAIDAWSFLKDVQVSYPPYASL